MLTNAATPTVTPAGLEPRYEGLFLEPAVASYEELADEQDSFEEGPIITA